MLTSQSQKFWKGRSRKFWKGFQPVSCYLSLILWWWVSNKNVLPSAVVGSQTVWVYSQTFASFYCLKLQPVIFYVDFISKNLLHEVLDAFDSEF